jgi:hypothetical protein
MSAQTDFIKGMYGFRLAHQHQDLFDKAPNKTDHNLRSRVLRNGIAIIGFSILEHFIRTRVGEILMSFDKISTPFENLPDKIKQIATKGAIKGIANRMKYEDNFILFTQTESSILASSANTPYQISRYSIGWDSPNLSIENIGEIFNCFAIQKGWEIIDNISGNVNLTILSSKAAFQNAAQRRNDAAHNVDAIIHPVDLESFVKEAYVIALGFDMVITKAYHKIFIGDTDYLNNSKKITDKDISLRKISYEKNNWKEFLVGRKKAVKTSGTKKALFREAFVRAKKQDDFLLCIEKDGLPSSWSLPSLL